MAHNTQFDSLEWPKIDFPYNRIESELSDKPRFIRGQNAYVTLGGKLAKRPGNTLLTGSVIAGKRIDRLWIYETLESPPKVYIVASMFDTATVVWQMYWIRMSAAMPAWTQFSSLRQINNSTKPHEAVVSRGLLYVKGYPSGASGEKLGTVVFDGTDLSLKFWGILPPTAPMALVGQITGLASDVATIDASITVNSNPGFVNGDNIQIDNELLNIVSIGGGTTWTVLRGQENTVIEAHAKGAPVVFRDWSASAHQITVQIAWAYTYAYKTSTGHVSSRAPLETNIDKLPSRTGPFNDLIPKFTLTGNADTTNVPKIIVFRSTDGGGTYYELEEITNTGGSITYSDDSFESGSGGGTFSDPVPDAELNKATPAPTLTSNSPPPTVISPQVVGTDTPTASTPLASYQARLWMGIGNIVFFSGEEEITLGIPEEAWPSGINGNFFRFQYPITNIAATSSALYVFTLQASYEITGTNLQTFNVNPIFENLGMPYGHPRAITRYEDTLVILTHDFRIARLQDSSAEVVSDPLFTDLIDAANGGSEFDIKFFGDLEKEWIFVAGHRDADTTRSLQWVLDTKKSKTLQEPFWFLPWTIRTSAMASGRIDDSSSQRRLVFAMYDQSGSGNTCLVQMDPTARTGGDFFVTAATGFSFDAVTNLFMVPTGNHVNNLRRPGITPVVYDVSLDRLLFSGDTDPLMYYFTDDLWSDPRAPLQYEDPARRDFSKQYKTLTFGIQEVAQHVAVEISKFSSQELFECQNLIITFNSDSGA